MARSKRETISAALGQLVAESPRPVYALDSAQEVVSCNPALAEWLGLASEQIVGRRVEYHSEVASADQTQAVAPITGLCPPPAALVGQPTAGTVSCVDRSGHLVHRRAQFVPLAATGDSTSAAQARGQDSHGILVVLDSHDLTAAELSQALRADAPPEALHRAIRQFRRTQVAGYAPQTLLGVSPALGKVRAQVAAAAVSGANALVVGPAGSGREHVARAIHYQHSDASHSALLPVDCSVVSEESLRRTLATATELAVGRRASTLLLLDIDTMPAELQGHFVQTLAADAGDRRILATLGTQRAGAAEPQGDLLPAASTEADQTQASFVGTVNVLLREFISTITIQIPPLHQRLEDLPLLAQFFVEAANAGSSRQVGGLHEDALDLLTLYGWPGELDELRDVIKAAHEHGSGTTLLPGDLPVVIHHAVRAASQSARVTERIQLDGFLAQIERELIERALREANHNKAEAARLLGITRARFYRRMLHFELIQRGAGDPDDEQGGQ